MTKGEMKMKYKGIVPIAVLVMLQLCSNLRARSTTAYEAEMAVKGWLKIDPQPLETTIGREVMRIEPFTDDEGETIYYVVYLQPSGFVIVSGDDFIEPIICFADDGQYSSRPDNPLGALVTRDLAGRLDGLSKGGGIQAMSGQSEPTDSQLKWSQLIALGEKESGLLESQAARILDPARPSDLRVGPLVKTKWAQQLCCNFPAKACYNYYTPRLENGSARWDDYGNPNNYPCGCAATAMAQLIRYHTYPSEPNRITETITLSEDLNAQPTESRDEQILGGDENGGPYDWSLMIPEPDCFANLNQRKAIGALCHDVGVSINMNYTSSGSAPQDDDKPKDALINIFKYANVVMADSGGSNIGPGLIQMINPNLDADSPVILYVSGEMPHAVVCDGYGYNSSTLYHHINLGWYGTDDAWYNLPDARCSMEFNTVTTCFYNIFKTDEGEIISGRVTDSQGNPVAEALVTAEVTGTGSYSDTTNTKGIYALRGVPADSNYVVSVTKAGYTFNSREVRTSTSRDFSAFSGNRWAVDFPSSDQPNVIYVDKDAPGRQDGSSWHDAFVDLQDALTVAAISTGQVMEIRLATGTYKPDQGTGFRSLNFQLIDGVAIKGSYAGFGQADPNARDMQLYQTILSGDLNGDDLEVSDPCDLLNEPSRAENSFNIVNGSGTNPSAILDGVTITGGNANGRWSSELCGGGIYVYRGSPILRNCTLLGNSAQFGGAMYNERSRTSIDNCTINSNYASNGGAMYNWQSTPSLERCKFNSNSAEYGGAVYNYQDSNPIISDCVFNANRAFQWGGGLFNQLCCSPSFGNCEFSDNSAQYGGGMCNCDNSNPSLDSCVFNGNSAVCDGGGMNNMQNSSPSMEYCQFVNNTCDFGGGLFNSDRSSPTLSNCNIVDNQAIFAGGGVYNWNNAGLIMTNCIVWGNNQGQLDQYNAQNPMINYSDIQGGFVSQGIGNIDVDPLFVDPANGDYHLKSQAGHWDPSSQSWVIDDVTSPCIDAGDPASPVGDEPSPNGGIINMGAYGGTTKASKSP
jgi:hypothetical protein